MGPEDLMRELTDELERSGGVITPEIADRALAFKAEDMRGAMDNLIGLLGQLRVELPVRTEFATIESVQLIDDSINQAAMLIAGLTVTREIILQARRPRR